MTGFQKFMKLILPKQSFAAIEAESRSWMLTCECGFSRSIWDLGGMRYKANDNARTFMKCPACKQRKWLTLVRAEPQVAGAPGAKV